MILSYHEERQRGSVSERHAARLEALEATVARLLSNEAKLIADSVTAQAAVASLADFTQALSADLGHAEQSLRQTDLSVSLALAEFRTMTLLGRLRWLVTGR